jgi:mono/diheme cytochrome c family protein
LTIEDGESVIMRSVSTTLVFGMSLALAATVTLVAQNPGGSPEGKALKNPVSATAESIAAGQALYAKNCRFCHGAEGKGDGTMAPKDSHPSDLTDAKWDRGATDGEIFLVIQNGAAPEMKMKGYKGRIADKDIWNVVNYVRSLGPKK